MRGGWGPDSATSLCSRGDPVQTGDTCSHREAEGKQEFSNEQWRSQRSRVLGAEEVWRNPCPLPPFLSVPPAPSTFSCPQRAAAPSPCAGLRDPQRPRGLAASAWAARPHTLSARGGLHRRLPRSFRLPSLLTTSVASARWPRYVLQDHRQFYLPENLDVVFMVLRRLAPEC